MTAIEMIGRLKEKDIEVIINGDGTVHAYSDKFGRVRFHNDGTYESIHDAEVAATLKSSINIKPLESITEFNKYIASK